MGYQRFSQGATAGNANADFVVPTSDIDGRGRSSPNDTIRRLLYAELILTTDATVANRNVMLSLIDADAALVIDFHPGASIVASQTAVHSKYMQGIYRETSFVNNAIQIPIGRDVVMLPGWTMRFNIENGVAGDSFTVSGVWADR